MTHSPDDAEFRTEFGPYMETLKEMWLDEAIRPTLLKAVRKEITWEELERRRGGADD